MDDIISGVLSEEIFGLVKCNIRVPDHFIEYFSEFPPIFKNAEIKLEDVGEHMQKHCEKLGRKRGVKRSLISSMRGDGIILLTPLLKRYLELGLVVTDIELVIEYNDKAVFEWFQDKVCDDRRRADKDPVFAVRGKLVRPKETVAYGQT